MKAHCIELLLEDGANNATLRINEGTWVLTKESGTLVQVDDGNVQIMQSLTEIEIRLPPGCRPARPPRVTVHALTGSEFFDGELSRDKTGSEGRIGVRSPEGDETDYLLQGQHCRRVTLPFSPASRRSNCE